MCRFPLYKFFRRFRVLLVVLSHRKLGVRQGEVRDKILLMSFLKIRYTHTRSSTPEGVGDRVTDLDTKMDPPRPETEKSRGEVKTKHLRDKVRLGASDPERRGSEEKGLFRE